ncbi:NAD(P)H azoreductase [Dickeya dianthicola]|uniref:SDR family NAD(P)-dependent oxidoreductase n=2 Tax=Dickeya dianthicola TaxID=204039 RepID=A0AAP2D0D5_9GAMM|nr:SDR family oxidoreductase [Dickeya dianthicola]ATO32528.1 Oxidoreductase [Dickeya dianthicola RNS04.9]AYC18538.1 NAD(P)H azoreductase [Dickeya dianthicola]MBI0439195.1 SDR family oxidoreductase [Dickeya dianthicola]MBI0449657.1 SDR family oxidoreductase [Dickeya dianthicola]MBI0454288.1 SDR family oxidoreductase [Dickeya dianthicola]
MPNYLSSQTRKPRVALAGATGRVGTTLTTLLAADPIDVVVLTRDPNAARLPAGIDAVKVDFTRVDGLCAALRGVDRLFISHGTSTEQIANEIALIDAAVTAGVQHIVKLSALGPATRLLPIAWHMQIEAHLARQPIASTVLRPTAFSDVLKRLGPLIAAGSWTGAAGNGRVNFIDTRDIADVARIALLEEIEPESQRAYHLTGPRAWTMTEVAEELTRLLGHPVTYVHISPAQQREALLGSGLSSFTTDLLLGLDRLFRESAIGETTLTVEEITGKAPRSLTEWLTDNLTIFQR